jgi:hypothetical protein
MDYKNDLQIDESALDIELLEQPNLMMIYSENLAETRKKFELKKSELEVKRAELDKAIRTNPRIYGIEKITESVVSNTIILQSDYQKIQEELIILQYEYDIAKFASSAMSSRNYALGELVKLHGMNYFIGPSVPRDLSNEYRNYDREMNKKIKIGGKE